MARAPSRLVGTLVYVAFMAVFVEVALQAFYFATAGAPLFARVGRPMYVPNEWSVFFNKPNLEMVHNTNEFRTVNYTNSAGFRVSERREEYAQEPPPGTFRVMLLGPSFAFGWGVNFEDSFAAHLERSLAEGGFAGGRRVEILNAGVPSLGATAQLVWFDHVGSAYRPDLVIQFIYGSMAVGRDAGPAYRVTDDGYLVPRDVSFGQELRQRLKQLATVFYGWVIYARVQSALGGEAAPERQEVLGAGRKLEMQTAFDPARPEVAAALAFYDDLAATVARHGSKLLVVYFPLSYSVHAEDLSRWKHLGVHDVPSQVAFDEAFCRHLREARAVACLNVTQDLVEAAQKGERLYFWLDIHWTPAGNRVVAESVARSLLARPPEERVSVGPSG
jgi:hypothetical protein